MSVSISGNPWVLAQDGAGTNPVGFEYKTALDVKDMVITKCLTAGSRIYFTDESGRQVVDFIATAGEQSFRIGKLGIIYGLKCVVFDEGELTIAV